MARPRGSKNSPKDGNGDQPAIGHNSNLTGDQREKLAGFVAEIERVDMEAREIASERGGIYKSAKEQGFDTKALKAVIAARRLEKTERESRQNTIDAYMHALGMLADTPLGKAAMSREFADPPFAAPHDEARRA
jgi:uncharacterized protein (UPF0335 family)